MDQTRVIFSLRWKILAWFFVNLVVLGAVLFLFLRVQFRVGINSLLAGSTSDRLETVARPLVNELRGLPQNDWGAALDRAAAGWRGRGLRVALFRDDGAYVAGDFREVPAEVRQTLVQHEARNHAMRPPPGNGNGRLPGPPPDHDGPFSLDEWVEGPVRPSRPNPERGPGPPLAPSTGPERPPLPAAATGP